MSTTSHKSRTRKLSEAASKKRIHTSREDRVLTKGGKTKISKVRNEGRTAKAVAKTAKVKRAASAQTAKKRSPVGRRKK